MAKIQREQKIIIVGGGFGGIRAALDLDREKLPQTRITLISDKPHFEFNPALYRVVTGNTPLEVCVPLREIFFHTSVEVLEDTIVSADLSEKTLQGKTGSAYTYDYLVLALGSVTAYFDIPGMEQHSFSFKSIAEALRLKQHLHELFETHARTGALEPVRIVVVGAGPSGAELAAQLSFYCKRLASHHQLAPSRVVIDLVEAAPRILPLFPEDFTQEIEKRLTALGVAINTGKGVIKKEGDTLYFKDGEITAQTVIWTAGIRPHPLYGKIDGLTLAKSGRVAVDEYLQAKGKENVFIVGDAADTPYAGMAQTALHQGRFAAEIIKRKILGFPLYPYLPHKPVYAVPVGKGWAAIKMGKIKLYGKLGWLIRRMADLRFFLSILPIKKALAAFRSEGTLCETCAICAP